jgi:hypothetical protein
MRTVKVEYPPGSGQSRDAVSVKVVSANEPWAEYALEDGSRIKAKAVLVDVLRIEGEYDLEGNPAYLLKANGVMSVTPQESMRKK